MRRAIVLVYREPVVVDHGFSMFSSRGMLPRVLHSLPLGIPSLASSMLQLKFHQIFATVSLAALLPITVPLA